MGTGAGTVAGAHIGPGQDGFPDSEAVRIKQPLNRRFRVEDPQLAVETHSSQLSRIRASCSCSLMHRLHEVDTAAFDLLMLHQGQIDLIGVAPAAPLLPNQPSGGQLLHGFNDLPVADLHLIGQRMAKLIP